MQQLLRNNQLSAPFPRQTVSLMRANYDYLNTSVESLKRRINHIRKFVNDNTLWDLLREELVEAYDILYIQNIRRFFLNKHLDEKDRGIISESIDNIQSLLQKMRKEQRRLQGDCPLVIKAIVDICNDLEDEVDEIIMAVCTRMSELGGEAI